MNIQGSNRMFENDPVPGDVDVNVDAYVYRIRRDIDYRPSLTAIMEKLLAGSESFAKCSQAAICFAKPLP